MSDRSHTASTAVAALLAALVVFSAVAPMAALAAPSGLTTVPDSNITQDVPGGETVPVSAADLEGNVLASSGHADTMEVVVTTPEHADEVMGTDSNVIGGGEMAIVFRDSTDHESREVAVDAGLLGDALGYSPEMIRGTHSSGDTWRSEAIYEDGYLSMQIESWSSNTVTFSGEVSLTGSYTDGSTVSYDVSSLDAVSDFSVNVTGSTATEWDNESGQVSGSDSLPVSVSGNVQPTGPELGEPNLTAEGVSIDHTEQASGTDSYTWDSPPSYVGTAKVVAETTDGSTVDVRYEVLVDGTEVAGGTFSTNEFATNKDITVNEPIDSSLTFRIAEEDQDTAATITATQEVQASAPQSFTVSTDTGESISVSNGAGSGAVDISTTTGSVSTDTSKPVNLSLDFKERTQTVDPSIEVNGHKTGFSGTLADGSTASLSVNDSWIESGTNTVNVSVGGGSLSADAPTPSVDLNYNHDAQDKVSVNYSANKWSEAYNVSRTYADATSNAQLTIPHDGNVVGINSVEYQINGNGWTSTSDYTLDGTTLTVDVGDLNSGDTVDVRTDARRVAVAGGSITVIEPTAKGNRLDTKIRLDTWSDGDHIGLGGSPDARKIHYTYNDPGGEYVRIESDGVQQLYIPNGADGSEMRVSTIPVQADVKSGAARFEVPDPSATEPEFRVAPGSTEGDTVEYTFVDAADDQKYSLYSVSQGVVRDSGTANSPLTLTDDDSEETLMFKQEDDANSSSGDASLMGPIQQPTGDGPLNSVPVILLAYVGALIALYIVDQGGTLAVRNPIPSMVPFVGGRRVRVPLPGSQGPLFWGGTVASTLIVLEFLSNGLISRTIFRTVEDLTSPLSSVVPLAGIVGVGLLGYYLYRRFIVGQNQSRDIVIRSDGGEE
jgi:hypothetical protein